MAAGQAITSSSESTIAMQDSTGKVVATAAAISAATTVVYA